MIPFFSVGSPPHDLFIGPVAKALDGADISLFIGLPVAGVLYWVLCRSIDVAAETRRGRGRGEGARGGRARAPRAVMGPGPTPGPPPRRSAPGPRPRRDVVAAALARIAAADGELNAFTVVTRDAALATGGRGRRRVASAARWPASRSRSRTTSGWPGCRPPTARGRCATSGPSAAARACQRLVDAGADRRRQDQQPGVLLPRRHRQRAVRRRPATRATPTRTRGRVERRVGGRRGRPAGAPGRRHRRRGLDPHPVGVLRRRTG